MPVKYSVVSYQVPTKPDAESLHYPRIQYSGTVTLRDIAREIGSRSSLNAIDVMAAIEAFLNVIPEHLADGQIVKLGDFGTFSLTLKCSGAEKPEQVSASHINSSHILFRPGREVKTQLKRLQFVKVRGTAEEHQDM